MIDKRYVTHAYLDTCDARVADVTHVRTTLEVGTVHAVKTESKGRANKRMRIRLD